jgi:hypothetical protein
MDRQTMSIIGGGFLVPNLKLLKTVISGVIFVTRMFTGKPRRSPTISDVLGLRLTTLPR